jgi:flagellin
MTNASAMTALKTLQMTNKSLDQTENRISTGYKVATASDNAAYWSIATTMRSDNSALSTVQDALGLGAATVDVAYTAMESVKDVLDQIKNKLVTASQPGVDKSKIQADITELQKQLTTYANSASFSGNNWLSVNTDDSTSYSATQSVVSSFNRSSDNQVSISTIDIDIKDVSLFDAGAGKGLLEDSGKAGTATAGAVFAWDEGDLDNGGTVTVATKIDGKTQNIDIKVNDAAGFTLDNLISGLNAGLKGATASKDTAGTSLVLTSSSLGLSSTVEITGITAKKEDGSGATLGTVTGVTLGPSTTGSDTGGIGIMDINITDATASDLAHYSSVVEAMSQKVTTAAANLGSVKSRIDMQQDFVKNLMDAVDRGVGALVDADMSQESTRLQALQTQQQLGIQALSIANSNSQSILSLFR